MLTSDIATPKGVTPILMKHTHYTSACTYKVMHLGNYLSPRVSQQRTNLYEFQQV